MSDERKRAEKRKSEVQRLRERVDELTAKVIRLEAWAGEAMQHMNRLQDQVLVNHVRGQALAELWIEDLPRTKGQLDKRCETIFKQLQEQGVHLIGGEATEDAAVPDAGPESSDAPTEAVVDEPHEVPEG